MAGKKTLLIEAGDDQGEKNPHERVPTYHAMSTEDPSMSWDYYIQHYPKDKMKKDTKMAWTPPQGGEPLVGPESPVAGSKMRGIFYPRSGTLGGCTAHK
jgi:choline dehydrogenase